MEQRPLPTTSPLGQGQTIPSFPPLPQAGLPIGSVEDMIPNRFVENNPLPSGSAQARQDTGVALRDAFMGLASEQWGMEIGQLRKIMQRVGYHESKLNPRKKQGVKAEHLHLPQATKDRAYPGRGIFQFEKGTEAGAHTAGNRVGWHIRNHPERFAGLKSEMGSFPETTDAANLTVPQQQTLFIAYHLQKEGSSLAGLNTEERIVDWWARSHNATKDPATRRLRKAAFRRDVNHGIAQGILEEL